MKPAGTKPKKSIDANYASIIAGENNQKGNIVLAHEVRRAAAAQCSRRASLIQQPLCSSTTAPCTSSSRSTPTSRPSSTTSCPCSAA